VTRKTKVGLFASVAAVIGLISGVTLHSATSYIGSDLSIADGALVYQPDRNRNGEGFVGIGLSNVNALVLGGTPNMAVSGNLRVHGSFSVAEVAQVLSQTSGTITVDWRKSNNQRVDFAAAWAGGTATFAFTNPNGTGIYTLQLRYTNTSSTFGAFSWPSSVKWPLGEAPVLSTPNLTTNDHTDTIYFFYEGGAAKYYGVRGFGNR